jgi:hypothetical protein
VQLEIGLPGQVLQQDYSIIEPITTNCWLKLVWEFAWEHEVEIQEMCPKLELYCRNDHYLVEEFIC